MSPQQKLTASRVIAIPGKPTRDSDFAEFGEIVHNPALHELDDAKYQSTSANQGTATKWLDVSRLSNHYNLAPSKFPARAVMNMFVCEPRELIHKEGADVLPIKILERHPFTSQTFIPIGVSPDDVDTRYLVVVAPTLPTSTRDEPAKASPVYPVPQPRRRRGLLERLRRGRPNLFTNDYTPTTTPQPLDRHGRSITPKGPGGPDLDRLQAFVLRGDQAVTYGPGTWHAPMIVLGRRMIDFVVVQHANDVPLEDCQEILIGANDGGSGLVVNVG
ncbi:ureidoglycolate hydrolase, partial [Dissoconium aciculare CBS 342.82]|uniref:Ureidoglycolate hydrolase n=1 Tax=Dissoconium aciculare CBS 342.82 TaxID=1314786 RepID=A0A6J3M9C9_9PEZI